MNRLPSFVQQHLAALRGLLVFTVITGIVYPLAMLGLAQGAFNHQANGSLVSFHHRVVGSSLLCQEFVDAKGNPLPQYFQPRPSAASSGASNDFGCDPLFSAASNLGPTNPKLIALIKQRQQADLRVRPRADLEDPVRRRYRVWLRPRPGHLAGLRGHPGGHGSRPPGTSARRRCRPWSSRTRGPARSGSSASRSSTCCC